MRNKQENIKPEPPAVQPELPAVYINQRASEPSRLLKCRPRLPRLLHRFLSKAKYLVRSKRSLVVPPLALLDRADELFKKASDNHNAFEAREYC